MSQQTGIPGIVRNGVVVPQTSQSLPEGARVEIMLKSADMPQSLLNEIKSWDVTSDESWKMIDAMEADQK
jgi:predicted DNA-binding antitoxin AbrB/MazE fold protein